MNKQETAQILAIIKTAYPQFYARGSQQDINNAINLWHDMFIDDDVTIVAMSVKALIACDTTGFPPTIGNVKEYMAKLQEPAETTEQEAWNTVRKALSNSMYNSEEEFAKLPNTIKSIVGDSKCLKEWSMTNKDQLETVIASNFMRSYRTRSKNEKEFAKLPKNIKNMAKKIASNKVKGMIGESENK